MWYNILILFQLKFSFSSVSLICDGLWYFVTHYHR